MSAEDNILKKLKKAFKDASKRNTASLADNAKGKLKSDVKNKVVVNKPKQSSTAKYYSSKKVTSELSKNKSYKAEQKKQKAKKEKEASKKPTVKQTNITGAERDANLQASAQQSLNNIKKELGKAKEQIKVIKASDWKADAQKAIGDKDLQFEQKLGLNKDLKAADIKFSNEVLPMGSYAARRLAKGLSFGASEAALKHAAPEVREAISDVDENLTKEQKVAGTVAELVGTMVPFAKTSSATAKVGKLFGNKVKPAGELLSKLSDNSVIRAIAESSGVDPAKLSAKVLAGLEADLGINLTLGNVQALSDAIQTDGTLSDKIAEYAKNQAINMGLGAAVEFGGPVVKKVLGGKDSIKKLVKQDIQQDVKALVGGDVSPKLAADDAIDLKAIKDVDPDAYPKVLGETAARTELSAKSKAKLPKKAVDDSQYRQVDDVVEGINRTIEAEQGVEREIGKALDNMPPANNSQLVNKLQDARIKVDPTSPRYQQNSLTPNEIEDVLQAAEDARTRDSHVRQGYTTITSSLGDADYQGDILKKVKSGEMSIDVHHDVNEYDAAAKRLMDEIGTNSSDPAVVEENVGKYIDKMKSYLSGETSKTLKEQRKVSYDVMAAVDFANANKDKPWAKELYLTASEVGAEQVSVGALTMNQWQKIAMSNPVYRAEAAKKQLLNMVNKSTRLITENGSQEFQSIEEFVDYVRRKDPRSADRIELAINELRNAEALEAVQSASEKVIREARKHIPVTFIDNLTQLRYIAMLSSPKTHVRNLVGNIVTGITGQTTGAVTSAIQGKYVKKGLVPEGYLKSSDGISVGAWNRAHQGAVANIKPQSEQKKAFKALAEAQDDLKLTTFTSAEEKAAKVAEVEALHKKAVEAEKALADSRNKHMPKKPEARRAKEWFYDSGQERLLQDAQKYEKQYGVGNERSLFMRGADKVSKVIGSALEGSDAISVEARACEVFEKVLDANNWRNLDDAGKAYVEDYAAQVASYKALSDTYREKTALSEALNNLVREALYDPNAPTYRKVIGRGLHMVQPFITVPVNMARKVIEYTPASIIGKKKKILEAFSNGDWVTANRLIEKEAAGLVGTSIMTLGALFAIGDADAWFINASLGSGLEDKNKKENGIQQYSITIGDKNISLDWATPVSGAFMAGVELTRQIQNAVMDSADKAGMEFSITEIPKMVSRIVSGTVQPLLDTTLFQGIEEMLDEVKWADDGTSPAMAILAGMSSNYIESYIPAVVNNFSRSLAPYDYQIPSGNDTEYFLYKNASKIPFLSNKVLGAKTNPWGEIVNEKKNTGDYAKSFALNMLSPANVKTVTNSEANKFVTKLYRETGKSGVIPFIKKDLKLVVGKDTTETLKLSPKQLAEYNKARAVGGQEALRFALEADIFNQYEKDSKGHKTILVKGYTPEEKDRIAAKLKGKGVQEAIEYIMKDPIFKEASSAKKASIISKMLDNKPVTKHNNLMESNEAKGGKKVQERAAYIAAGGKGVDYDYINEINGKDRAVLDAANVDHKIAVQFEREAISMISYTPNEDDEFGTATPRFSKKSVLAWFDKHPELDYATKEALYNTHVNGKPYAEVVGGGSGGGRGKKKGKKGRSYAYSAPARAELKPLSVKKGSTKKIAVKSAGGGSSEEVIDYKSLVKAMRQKNEQAIKPPKLEQKELI